MKIYRVFSPKFGFKDVLFDDDDFEFFRKKTIHVCKKGNKFYARLMHGRRFVHRFILNPSKEEEVDHINGNGLDNRKCNLRKCNHTQNLWNTGISVRNKTGFKGVFYDKKRKKYKACITVNGKKIYIGAFKTAKQASKKYNELSIIHHGKFSFLKRNI